MNELWDYKVDPERFASWLEPRERKIVGLKDESQKKKRNSILMGQMRKKMKPGMKGSKKVNHSSNK